MSQEPRQPPLAVEDGVQRPSARWQRAVADTVGKQGLVVENAGEEELAVAVRRVLDRPALRDRLVAAQREQVEVRFSSAAIDGALAAGLAPHLGPVAGGRA